MARHGMSAQKAAWMQDYEAEALKLDPGTAGRVDWDNAIFSFNRMESAIEAATKHFRQGCLRAPINGSRT